MISFDIESLFTNISLKQTIQIVMSKIFNDKRLKKPDRRIKEIPT